MLKISGLTKHFGGQSIFRHADWFVGAHDRVALVGRNGSGKSTLLKIIAGEESCDEGTIDRPKGLHIGYLAQSGFVVGTGSVREEARQAFREVLSLESELGEIERRLPHAAHGELERLSVRAAELHERLAILGANEIDRRIHQVLTGLGFRERDFDRPMGDLSGGWQMRAALARILLERPEMLMLDEPTNHLDLEAREWLEGYLQDYPYAFVLVSHDRYFLNVTVERVCEIAGCGMDNYAGGYGYYEAEREKRYALRLKAYEEQQDEIKRLHRFIDRNRANKRMAGRTHSRMLVLEKMERLDPPDPPPRPLRMRYPHCPHSGRVVLELDRAGKRYGGLRVLEGVSLRIERGARVALVGPNGAGKSTLMRLLAGHEPPDAGTRTAGYRVEMAYFAQDEGQRFNPRATVYETILGLSPNDFVPELRGLLGAFLFSGDSVEKRVGALSGGELNRLAIACLLVRPSNLLLLDEPTNHLDIVSKDALLESLRHYPGTIVFVSHDRHFLEALADHVIEVGGGGLREYHGNYASYLWRRAREASGEVGAPPAPAASGGAAPAVTGLAPGLAPGGAAAGAPATEAKAPVEAARAGGARGSRGRTGPGGRLGEVEREIADLEARKQRFAQALGNPKLFADPAKSAFYMRELKELEEPLQRLYEEWARLSERGFGGRREQGQGGGAGS